ncbi:hypothetical protein C8R45DRAFT_1037061 [Mycena sanguinolenta]|nr:hypothetical protein C8R45DRAFT_1037061 [Mycena sanguinolenta]
MLSSYPSTSTDASSQQPYSHLCYRISHPQIYLLSWKPTTSSAPLANATCFSTYLRICLLGEVLIGATSSWILSCAGRMLTVACCSTPPTHEQDPTAHSKRERHLYSSMPSSCASCTRRRYPFQPAFTSSLELDECSRACSLLSRISFCWWI